MLRFKLSVAVLAAVAALVACSAAPEPPSEAEIRRNNQGVALMGQYRYDEAHRIFTELAEARPEWLDVRVNAAIALLNRQGENDDRRALEMVQAVLEEDSQHLRARYVAGLMQLYLGDAAAALETFAAVRAAAPDDAHAAYFAGQAAAQAGRLEAAANAYRRAIELDPYLRSAYYAAALALRQLGEPGEARELIETYQRFENNPRAHLAEFRYTRMGPLAEAKAVSAHDARIEVQDPDGPLFAEATSLAETGLAAPIAGLTTVDLDGNGLQDLFVAGGPGQGNRVLRQTADGFTPEPDHPLAAIGDVVAAGWGDLDNNGSVDVYLCRRGGNLLLAGGAAGWSAAPGAGDVSDTGHCADVAVFDADHDGDLDLFVVNRDGPNELFNNNLNGSWRRLSEETGAGLDGGNRASRSVLTTDLDGDRVVDLFTLQEDPPHQAWINDRLWQYRTVAGLDAFAQVSLVAVSAGDFDADGQTTLVGLDRSGVLALWQRGPDGVWQSNAVADIELTAPATATLAVLDFSGDGRPEILVHHDSGFSVYRVSADEQRAELLFSESVELLTIMPVLLDAARGPSLVGAVHEGGEVVLKLWAPGTGRHAFTAVAPLGRSDRGDGIRSNASGIGTGIVARVGSDWIVTDAYDRHSAPGQSLQPVAIGLGGRDRADFIRLFWTDGVLQTEMDLAAGEIHRVAETQRQLASCPILFAWNGERHEFVSDLLGVGGIGFLLAPGVYSEPRPWEFFRFPEGSIAPRDGRYEVKIGEPMQEIAYIDTARLHVYDLPPGWALALDERMHTGGGPAPTGETVFYREASALSPQRAINDRGEDVTATVLHADHEAAPPGARRPQFLGLLQDEHILTLEFGKVINPPGSRPVLVADGWVEYPYSQTLFSAWQAEAEYRPPSLEAFADGRWQMVHEQFGYPAGMPREMSLPLDELPAGTTALRLSGNWEVYWDRIRVVHAEPPPVSLVVHELGIEHARLAKTGFARRDTFAQHLPYYDYADRSPYWDTEYASGYYTALGPVEPLVTEANDAFAVFGPGEELHMEFTAPAPAARKVRRVIVLEARGYAKDMDLYTKDGGTVGPLPSTPGTGDTTRREALHERFLNRFQGGL